MPCRRAQRRARLKRRLVMTLALVIVSLVGMLAGLAPPAFAGTLTSPAWSVSNAEPGAAGVSYTYTFTTASTSALTSVTMTVPPGTGGTPAAGTVTPAAAAGGTVALASNTLTYTFTSATITSGTAVSIQITGLTNTSATGSYTSVVTTDDDGTAIDTGTTPAVAMGLTGLGWSVSDTTAGAAGVTYIYTFTSASTSALTSVTMTVPPGTGGTPAAGTVTPAAAAGGTVALASNTLTYTFTSATITSGTAVSIQITGLTNTSATGSYTSVISTLNGASLVDAGTTPAVSFPGSLTLTSPSTLTWAATQQGLDQNAVDSLSSDQQLIVNDTTGTGAGWQITVSATTFTDGTNTLPNTGPLSITGSTSSLTSATPSVACVGSCILPTDTTTYPVTIKTAASSPTAFTIYDASAGSGIGQITIGGSAAAHPIGWWVTVPASAVAGTYISTITVTLVTGP
jgi:hypothetical protein